MQAEDAPTPSSNAARFHTDVDDVFARIASRYDRLCDLFSLGIHRLWKRRAAALIADENWSDLLDAAAGTGDVALRVLKRQGLRPNQTMTVSDICPQMLAIAQQRLARSGTLPQIRQLDAHAMPEIPDASIDLYAISLGLKICDRGKVLHEALRVLRPGGRLIALEASNIRWEWLNRAYLGYMAVCMPVLGWLATGGDASAYRYLLRGIRSFPTAEALADELRDMGFIDVSFERLSLGIVAIHIARKPSPQTPPERPLK